MMPPSPVWNLRTVSFIPLFYISSLVLMSSPVLLSVLSVELKLCFGGNVLKLSIIIIIIIIIIINIIIYFLLLLLLLLSFSAFGPVS